MTEENFQGIGTTRRTIERQIREFVAAGSGLPSTNVIPGNDPNPPPKGVYCTVLLLTGKNSGVNEVIYSDSETDPEKTDVQILGRRVNIYSVQFYRDGAWDACDNLVQFPSTPDGQESLQERGLSWVKASDVRQIDSLIDSELEDRVGVDITLRYTKSTAQQVNSVASMEFIVLDSAESDLIVTKEVP